MTKTQQEIKDAASRNLAQHEELTTAGSEFVLFCNLMAIHSQLQNLKLPANEELLKKIQPAYKDAIGVISYLCNTITNHMAPKFSQPEKSTN